MNNKFGVNSLASIILEISDRCGININHVDTSSIDETVEGFILNNPITALNAINILRSSYFFDICANNAEFITFQKRGAKKEITVNSSSCIKISDNNFIEEIEIPKEVTLSAINLHFINYHSEYNAAYTYVNNETNSYTNKELIKFPILLTEDQAINIGKLILKNAAIEDRIIKFIIHNDKFLLRPTDFVILQHKDKEYSVRVISTELDHNKIVVIGIIDSRRNYFSIATGKKQANLRPNIHIDSSLIILDLPFMLENTQTPFLAMYLRHHSSTPLFAKLSIESAGNDWNNIATLNPSYSTGRVVDFNLCPKANIFMVDNVSFFLITGQKLDNYVGNDWQLAMIGKELVHFQKLEKIQEELYKISLISRGEMGTENHITKHVINEDFVIINSETNIIPVSEKLRNQKVFFKAAMIEKSIIYQDKANSSLEQYITKQQIIDDKLHLKWITRLKENNNWSSNDQININFTIFITNNEQVHQYKTSNNEIIININDLALSDDYKISILKST